MELERNEIKTLLGLHDYYGEQLSFTPSVVRKPAIWRRYVEFGLVAATGTYNAQREPYYHLTPAAVEVLQKYLHR